MDASENFADGRLPAMDLQIATRSQEGSDTGAKQSGTSGLARWVGTTTTTTSLFHFVVVRTTSLRWMAERRPTGVDSISKSDQGTTFGTATNPKGGIL
jgi:hypothetical protein